jgi:hypothetical protein
MTIDSDDLADVRKTASKILLAVLCLHIPIAGRLHAHDGRGRDGVVANIRK